MVPKGIVLYCSATKQQFELGKMYAVSSYILFYLVTYVNLQGKKYWYRERYTSTYSKYGTTSAVLFYLFYIYIHIRYTYHLYTFIYTLYWYIIYTVFIYYLIIIEYTEGNT